MLIFGDLGSGVVLREFDAGVAVGAVGMSADGSRLGAAGAEGRRLRVWDAASGRLVLEIELHHAAPGEVDVSAQGSELLVRLRDFQRLISLPDSLAGRPVAAVSLEDGLLSVAFDER